MIIIDTNYFFALLYPEDSLHSKALSLSHRVKDFPILYLEDVLKEMHTILVMRKSNKEAFDWIDSIFESEYKLDRQYNLSSMEYIDVLNFWRSLKDSRLSFVDAEILYLAQKYKFQVLSFDQEILRYLPKELVFEV